MDYNYSEEGSDLFNFGIENDSYVREGEGVKFTDTIINNPNGLTYDQALASYALSIMDGPINQDSRYLDALLFDDGQRAECGMDESKLSFNASSNSFVNR
ncbi:hypothetical protein Q0F98_13620 [Paenibacillus amylolyticus]|nr:hypothetical protein Q0F98_13620 [Paenibacillus amylolyticus]